MQNFLKSKNFKMLISTPHAMPLTHLTTHCRAAGPQRSAQFQSQLFMVQAGPGSDRDPARIGWAAEGRERE